MCNEKVSELSDVKILEIILKEIKPFCNEKTEISKNYSKDSVYNNFNIFTSVSNIYHKENMHSDILALILNPKTPCICDGSDDNLKLFVKLLREYNENIEEISFDKQQISVEREKGKLDIFIHDAKNGIIVENKINNAIDTNNQLSRYFDYARNKNIDVRAFVYIPLNHIKEPDISKYTCSDDIKNKIYEKLVVLPAVISSKKDLAHSFLDVCVQGYNVSNKQCAKIYIEHYSKLIKILGGIVMTKDVDKKIIEIMFSERNHNVAVHLVNIFKNQKDICWGVLGSIFADTLKREMGFYETAKDMLLKNIEGKSKVYMGFIPAWCTFGIVYESEKYNRDVDKDVSFSNIINSIENDLFLQKGKSANNYVSNKGIYFWVYENFIFDVLKQENTIENMTRSVVRCYRELENKLKMADA